MKRVRNILLIIVLALGSRAQQVGMYNHYFFKPMVYNPAFAGAGTHCHAMLLSRAQWANFAGAPQLNIFTLDGPVKKNKIGLGATFMNDRRGITIRNSGSLAYSYRLSFNEQTYILLGLSAGVVSHAIDYNKAVAEDYSDPTLMGGMQQRTGFDASAGFAFIWKGLQIGAAAPQLLANRLNFVDDTTTRTYYTHARHYMASARYRITLSKEKDIGIAPQFLMRMAPAAPMQFDGNLTLDWADKFWLGATYKSNYAISINAGVWAYRRLAIGYSYEVITAGIGQYAGISHEIMVNFKFGGKRGDPETPEPEETSNEEKATAYQERIDSLQQALSENQEQIWELNNKLAQQSKAQAQTQEQVAALEKKMQQAGTGQNQQQAPSSQGNNGGNQAATTESGAGSNPAAAGNQSKSGGGQQTTTGAGNESAGNGSESSSQNPGNQTQAKSGSGGQKAPAALDMMDSKVFESDVWIASYARSEYKNAANTNPKIGFYIVVGTFYYQDFAIAEAERFRKRGYKECNWVYSENTKHNYIFTNRVTSRHDAIRKVKEVQRTSGVPNAWILELK